VIPLYQVDAFASRPFEGNPAAVCLLEGEATDAWMQAVAAEMNLSETAFVRAIEDGFDLRWFTPAAEVDLCGHATLASAHVLWESGRLAADAQARFCTRSGVLTARRDGGWIEMDFPATPAAPADPPTALIEGLGVEITGVYRSQFDFLAELPSAAAVRGLRPNFGRLAEVPARGVIVTAKSDRPRADFVSRMFGPAIGIPEDPVTGSAHCCLGPFWAQRLQRSELIGYQASARGGVVRVRLAGERVLLGGRAVTVLVGQLHP